MLINDLSAIKPKAMDNLLGIQRLSMINCDPATIDRAIALGLDPIH